MTDEAQDLDKGAAGASEEPSEGEPDAEPFRLACTPVEALALSFAHDRMRDLNAQAQELQAQAQRIWSTALKTVVKERGLDSAERPAVRSTDGGGLELVWKSEPLKTPEA